MNKLYYGDCLTIMQEMPLASVDLIYLDPPFNSNRQYNAIYQDETGRPLPSRGRAKSSFGGFGVNDGFVGRGAPAARCRRPELGRFVAGGPTWPNGETVFSRPAARCSAGDGTRRKYPSRRAHRTAGSGRFQSASGGPPRSSRCARAYAACNEWR